MGKVFLKRLLFPLEWTPNKQIFNGASDRGSITLFAENIVYLHNPPAVNSQTIEKQISEYDRLGHNFQWKMSFNPEPSR